MVDRFRIPGRGRFQILSLGGGGYRGLYTASLLSHFECRNRRPIYESFDLFAGTSIGGIIAIGLAASVSAGIIKEEIERYGPLIFQKRTIRGRYGLFRPKYSPEYIRRAMENILGSEKKLKDIERRFVIPCVTLSSNAPQLFRTPHCDEHDEQGGISAIDVGIATASAPIYFPAHKINNSMYVDGGIVANAPDIISLWEAENYVGVSRSDIFMLSIGTTASPSAFVATSSTYWGLLGWTRKYRLLELTFSAQEALARNLCREVLRERYIHINEFQSEEQKKVLSLDAANSNATQSLKAMADSSRDRFATSAVLERMLSHKGEKYAYARKEEASDPIVGKARISG